MPQDLGGWGGVWGILYVQQHAGNVVMAPPLPNLRKYQYDQRIGADQAELSGVNRG